MPLSSFWGFAGMQWRSLARGSVTLSLPPSSLTFFPEYLIPHFPLLPRASVPIRFSPTDVLWLHPEILFPTKVTITDLGVNLKHLLLGAGAQFNPKQLLRQLPTLIWVLLTGPAIISSPKTKALLNKVFGRKFSSYLTLSCTDFSPVFLFCVLSWHQSLASKAPQMSLLSSLGLLN